MKENLGAHIAALRKAKGMTQEQLASALGISAPAVSKWETESSCPDITLLCPLARALGTNLDTLLQFEESLPDEQVAEHMNKIIETGREQGQEAAEEMGFRSDVQTMNFLGQEKGMIPWRQSTYILRTVS